MAPTQLTVNIVFGLRTIFVFPISSHFVTVIYRPSITTGTLLSISVSISISRVAEIQAAFAGLSVNIRVGRKTLRN